MIRKLSLSTQQHPVQMLLITLVLTGSAIAGLFQVQAPFIGPGIVLATVMIPIALIVDGTWLAIGMLSTAILSRVFMLVGAPSALNYVHFFITLIVLAKILLIRSLNRDKDAPSSYLIPGTMLLAVVVIISALANDWVALRPVLVWLTLSEPFILLRLIENQDMASRNRLRVSLIAMSIIQLPFAFWQFANFGFADPVQGTLIGLGSGAHTMAAICVIGGLLITQSTRGSSKKVYWPIIIALFSMGILSDAKQVYGALLAASLPFLLFSARSKQLRQAAAMVMVLGIILYVGARVWPALDRLFQSDLVTSYAESKVESVRTVATETGLAGVFLGTGPGNGISRIALLNSVSPTGYRYGNVPTFVGGSEASRLAELAVFHYESDGSSADTFLFSWMSIWSELGVVGLATYLLLMFQVWKYCEGCADSSRTVGQYLLVFAGTLAFIYTWLEEPAFVLFLVAAIGALPRNEDRTTRPHAYRDGRD